MESYDVVVIGAGNGGLTAAASLARKGQKVLLLERHNIPGGCATTFCRGRFEFEVALHQLSGIGTPEKPGPLRAILQRLGVMEEVEFVQMSDLYRVVVPGALDLVLKPERAAFIEKLQSRFPREKESVERFVDLVYNYFEEVLGANYLNDPDVNQTKYPLLFKYAFKNTKDVLDEFFVDPLIKVALSAYWGYIGVPPGRMSFTYLVMLLYSYLEFKPWHMKGGSQALSNALVDRFVRHGGTVRFKCGVEKILVENDAVQGVVTEHGERIAANYVVSNISKIATYVDLMDPKHRPAETMAEMRGIRPATSAFTLYIGFDCEPGELGITESTNFIMSYTDIADPALGRTEKADALGGYMLLSCYDIVDPEFSPPGACQVAIVTGQKAEPWYAVPPAQYTDMKYRCAEATLRQAEKVFPNLRDHIEEIEVATPLTHIRYLGHPGGAFYGFEQNVKDSLFMQPSRLSPVKGLFHAGAWVTDGGYQPTLESGTQAARAILTEIKGL
ncbi:MAG: NAD(P)/FAD-dependent oxidoreductase [Proteobacteria bacterium]|nr:NAD(P)/FAD-dependent oxidoreductase [Pseudomonadota bacterium]